jgi:hypothetical protein
MFSIQVVQQEKYLSHPVHHQPASFRTLKTLLASSSHNKTENDFSDRIGAGEVCAIGALA